MFLLLSLHQHGFLTNDCKWRYPLTVNILKLNWKEGYLHPKFGKVKRTAWSHHVSCSPRISRFPMKCEILTIFPKWQRKATYLWKKHKKINNNGHVNKNARFGARTNLSTGEFDVQVNGETPTWSAIRVLSNWNTHESWAGLIAGGQKALVCHPIFIINSH